MNDISKNTIDYHFDYFLKRIEVCVKEDIDYDLVIDFILGKLRNKKKYRRI
jgi:hypothetical protein